jgi:RecJ-like exonuclease
MVRFNDVLRPKKRVNKLEIKINITPSNLCPYCFGTGKLKAMQSAMTLNSKSIRVNDTSVKCNYCKGTGLNK